MQVKEMHPLCCLSLESPGIGNQSLEASVSKTRSLPASLTVVGSDCNAVVRGSKTVIVAVARIIYKWTNYCKGWRSRWFLLRNGVLSYAEIRWQENLNLLIPIDDVRLIGEISTDRLAGMDSNGSTMLRKNQKSSSGNVHLKVGIEGKLSTILRVNFLEDAFREAKANGFGITVIKKGELKLNIDEPLEEVEEQILKIGSKMYHDMIMKVQSVDINSLMKGVFGFNERSIKRYLYVV